MADKRTLLVLITLFNTLLLVAGVFIIFGATEYEVCNSRFCDAIKDFKMFYQTMFFSFGLLLAASCVFGFMAIFLDNQIMICCFGKMLILLLVLLFVVVWVILWGKGPTCLRSALSNAFKSYGKGSCRVDASIDALQRKFRCCGINGPEDWTTIRALEKTNISLEPPFSCCVPGLIARGTDGSFKCISNNPKGCFEPLRRYIWRSMSALTVIFFGVALNMTLATIGTFQYARLLRRERSTSRNETNFVTNISTALPNQATPLHFYHENTGIKNSASSTVV